jgi:hypothetical protein
MKVIDNYMQNLEKNASKGANVLDVALLCVHLQKWHPAGCLQGGILI